MRELATNLYQRVIHFGLAFMLAVSSLAVVGPFLLSQNAGAIAPHFEDFSSGVGDWLTPPQITAGGGVGVVSNGGSPHTKFGGYENTWTSDYTASIDVYLDPSWTVGEGFNYSVASNNSGGTHLRDFIFHVGVVEDYGPIVGKKLLVNGSNNSDSYANPFKLVNENSGYYYEVTEAGWYTLRHQFQNVGGVLSVNLSLLQSGTELWSVVRTNPADTIPAVVGGHRYGWFTFNSVVSGLSIDNVSLVANLPDTQRPQLSNISITPTINDNIGGVVTVYFDLEDETGVDLTKTRVLFADGPDTANAHKESAKFAPMHISGNSYMVEINTLDFVKANWTGQYNLAFNLWDVLGNQGSSKPADFRNILIDNSGPTSTLQTPVSGSHINGDQRFTFDVFDDTGVKSGYMRFQESSTQYPLQDGGNGEWYVDIDTSLLPDGQYTIDARFVDVFDRARYGANKGTVTIDSIVPTFTLTDDGSPRVPIANGSIINPAKLGDIDSNGNTIRFAKESTTDTLYVNDAPIFGHGYVGGTSGQIGARFNADGIYTVYTKDLAGNQSPTITFTVDTVAPIASIEVSSPAGTSDLHRDTVTITGVVDPSEAHIKSHWFEITNPDGTLSYAYNMSTDNLTFSFDLDTSAGDGEYKFRYVATDKANNRSDEAGHTIRTIVVDNTSPTVTIKSESLGGPDAWRNISFKLYDKYDIDYATINGVVKDMTNNDWSDINDVKPGTFGAVEGVNKLVVYDAAGNSATVVFTLDTIAPAVPANLLWTPTGGSALASGSVTNVATGAASWGASDADTVQYIYRYWNDIVGNPYTVDSPWQTPTGGTLLPGVFNQGEGTHHFSVAAVDAAGNQSDFSEPFMIVFDETAPNATITTTGVQNTLTPTIEGTVDPDATELELWIDGVLQTLTWVPGDTTWSFTTDELTAGETYALQIIAHDEAGNEGGQSGSIEVVIITPEIEDDPETEEDETTPPVIQTIITPGDVLGDQDDQTGEENGNIDENGSAVEAATDDKTGDSADNTILGLAWYWWLLILAALAAAGWWLVGAYRRRNAEE